MKNCKLTSNQPSRLLVVMLLLNMQLIVCNGQAKENSDPFVIQGQLTNCPEKSLNIFFEGENNQLVIDTLRLDGKGAFYLKTFKVKSPQKISIQKNRIQINDLYIAPGYDLTIVADGSNFKSIMETLTISGMGSAVNEYKILLNKVLPKLPPESNPYLLSKDSIKIYAKEVRELQDSIARIIFKKGGRKPAYFAHFKRMIAFDNLFSEVSLVLSHLKLNGGSSIEMERFLNSHFLNYQKEVFNEKYLISKIYTDFFIGGDYLDFLTKKDEESDSNLIVNFNYRLGRVKGSYSGKAKELVMYRQMHSALQFSKTIKRFNENKKIISSEFPNLTNPTYRKAIEKTISKKETELLSLQKGQPAPTFSLISDRATTHSLIDFLGRVVFIDLWASWCSPCRDQTAAMKALHDKYKNDSRIAIISIAVSDGIETWRKALNEDQPDWLQLIDKDGQVNNAYVANMIPQFIIIDKQGKIVSLDAPRPTEQRQLDQILAEELSK